MISTPRFAVVRSDKFLLHPADAIPAFLSSGCLIRVGAGFIALMLGSIMPDERLLIAGLPVGVIAFAVVLLCLPVVQLDSRTLRRLLISQLPLLPLGISILWSMDIEYGSYKFFNLLLSANVATLFFLDAIRIYGGRELARCLILMLAGILVAALVYKAQYGLLDRTVRFFLHGPITFARFMALGAVISVVILRGAPRFFLTAVFSVAMVWTASKGPIAAFAIVLLLLAFARDARIRRFLFVFVISIGLATWLFARMYDVELFSLGRLSLLWTFSTDEFNNKGDYTSLTGRYWMIVNSLQLIGSSPFGVGLGGWEASVADNLGLQYPHNLLIELWSEAGLLLGSLALLAFCAFVFSPRSVWKYCAILLFVSQLVSGDLLDARFLLVFSLLACLGPEPTDAKRIALHPSPT